MAAPEQEQFEQLRLWTHRYLELLGFGGAYVDQVLATTRVIISANGLSTNGEESDLSPLPAQHVMCLV